jgi:chromosome segregation ATPase
LCRDSLSIINYELHGLDILIEGKHSRCSPGSPTRGPDGKHKLISLMGYNERIKDLEEELAHVMEAKTQMSVEYETELKQLQATVESRDASLSALNAEQEQLVERLKAEFAQSLRDTNYDYQQRLNRLCEDHTLAVEKLKSHIGTLEVDREYDLINACTPLEALVAEQLQSIDKLTAERIAFQESLKLEYEEKEAQQDVNSKHVQALLVDAMKSQYEIEMAKLRIKLTNSPAVPDLVTIGHSNQGGQLATEAYTQLEPAGYEILVVERNSLLAKVAELEGLVDVLRRGMDGLELGPDGSELLSDNANDVTADSENTIGGGPSIPLVQLSALLQDPLELQTLTEELEAQLKQSVAQNEKLQGEVDSLTEKLADSVSLMQYESALSVLQMKICDLAGELSNLKDETRTSAQTVNVTTAQHEPQNNGHDLVVSKPDVTIVILDSSTDKAPEMVVELPTDSDEYNLFASRIENMRLEIVGLEDNIVFYKSQLLELKTEKSASMNIVETLTKSIIDSTQELQVAQEQRTALTMENKRLKVEMKCTEEAMRNLHSELQRVRTLDFEDAQDYVRMKQSDVQKSRLLLRELQDANTELYGRVTSTQNELETAVLERDGLSRRCVELSAQLNELREQTAQKIVDIREVSSRLDETNRCQLQLLSDEILQLKHLSNEPNDAALPVIHQLEDELEDLKRKLVAANGEAEEWRTKCTKAAAELASSHLLSQTYRRENAEIVEGNSDRHSLRSQIDALNQIIDEKDLQLQQMESESADKIQNLVAEVDRLQEQRCELNNIVVELRERTEIIGVSENDTETSKYDSEDIGDQLSQLKADNNSILESNSSLQVEISKLQALLECNQIDYAAANHRFQTELLESSRKSAELEKLLAEVSFARESQRDADGNIPGLRKKNDELEQKLRDAVKERDAESSKFEMASVRLLSVQECLQQQIQGLEQSILQVEEERGKDKINFEAECHRLRDLQRLQGEQIESFEEQLASAVKERETELQLLTAESDDRQAGALLLQQELATQTTHKETLISQLQALEVKCKLASDLSVEKSTLWQLERTEFLESVESLKTLLAEEVAKNFGLSIQCQEASDRLAADVQRSEERMMQLQSDLLEAQIQQRNFQQDTEVLRSVNENLCEDVKRLNYELTLSEDELNSMAQRVFDLESSQAAAVFSLEIESQKYVESLKALKEKYSVRLAESKLAVPDDIKEDYEQVIEDLQNTVDQLGSELHHMSEGALLLESQIAEVRTERDAAHDEARSSRLRIQSLEEEIRILTSGQTTVQVQHTEALAALRSKFAGDMTALEQSHKQDLVNNTVTEMEASQSENELRAQLQTAQVASQELHIQLGESQAELLSITDERDELVSLKSQLLASAKLQAEALTVITKEKEALVLQLTDLMEQLSQLNAAHSELLGETQRARSEIIIGTFTDDDRTVLEAELEAVREERDELLLLKMQLLASAKYQADALQESRLELLAVVAKHDSELMIQYDGNMSDTTAFLEDKSTSLVSLQLDNQRYTECLLFADEDSTMKFINQQETIHDFFVTLDEQKEEYESLIKEMEADSALNADRGNQELDRLRKKIAELEDNIISVQIEERDRFEDLMSVQLEQLKLDIVENKAKVASELTEQQNLQAELQELVTIQTECLLMASEDLSGRLWARLYLQQSLRQREDTLRELQLSLQEKFLECDQIHRHAADLEAAYEEVLQNLDDAERELADEKARKQPVDEASSLVHASRPFISPFSGGSSASWASKTVSHSKIPLMDTPDREFSSSMQSVDSSLSSKLSIRRNIPIGGATVACDSSRLELTAEVNERITQLLASDHDLDGSHHMLAASDEDNDELLSAAINSVQSMLNSNLNMLKSESQTESEVVCASSGYLGDIKLDAAGDEIVHDGILHELVSIKAELETALVEKNGLMDEKVKLMEDIINVKMEYEMKVEEANSLRDRIEGQLEQIDAMKEMINTQALQMEALSAAARAATAPTKKGAFW